ncbi:hypothetical protein N7492_007180 [Penicillium capsulatum]|uniref:Uncharacterized protein n=1 Tax=Penicillium capsulatum TaxID=69766 RepID=A0A9W9I1J1_9EURO|nr:hypothetical protein N7492_007180 [Penicillium capsulatum]KAJ6117018.1 hypothetical protein N7512_006743 [Penicillium capsulatum]
MSGSTQTLPGPAWTLEAVPRHQKRWLSFLSLRFGTVLCSMVGIICFAWALVQHENSVVYTDGIGAGFSSFNLGTSTYGFLWSSIFLLIVSCSCAVHPGVSIAFDCIGLLAQIITTLMYLAGLGEYHSGGYQDSGTADDQLYGVEVFGCAMLILGVGFYLALITCASKASHVRCKEGKEQVKPKDELA